MISWRCDFPVVNFFDALSQIIAKAIVFFNNLFSQQLFAVFDTLIAQVFQAMGYQVTVTSPISGIQLPPEDQPPGFWAGTMSRGIRDSWKQVATVATEGASSLMESTMTVVDAVQEQFTNVLTPYVDDFTSAIIPGSPTDPKMKEFADKIRDAFMEALEKVKPKSKSKITYEQARNSATVYLGSNIALNLVSRTLASAVDMPHIFKGIGIHKIVDGIWWGLGLNWLTWVALGPYMQSYIAKPLARHFRMLYSESDLTRSDILKAYKAGNMLPIVANAKLEYLGYDASDRDFLLSNIHVAQTDDDKQLTRSNILSALKLGYLTEDNAVDRLIQQGYSDDDISLLIKIALHEKDDKDRDLTRSQILRLYREQVITLEATQQHLKDMGYSDEEIQLMIELEDLKAYPNRKYLTRAQVGEYYKKEWMSPQDAEAYWRFLGYSDYEIKFFFQEYS